MAKNVALKNADFFFKFMFPKIIDSVAYQGRRLNPHQFKNSREPSNLSDTSGSCVAIRWHAGVPVLLFL